MPEVLAENVLACSSDRFDSSISSRNSGYAKRFPNTSSSPIVAFLRLLRAALILWILFGFMFSMMGTGFLFFGRLTTTTLWTESSMV